MEVANPPTAAAAAAAATSGADWRSQLHPMAREVMVKQIMKILRQHIPVRDSEVLNRLQKIAKGFEEKFYNSARTQPSYLWKIASLLRYVEVLNHNPNHQDRKGKAPMPESPGDVTIGQEYRDNIPSGSDDEPDHPGTDTAGPSKNIQTVEASDSFYSELSDLGFSSNEDTGTLSDIMERELGYSYPLFHPILEEEGTTNLKKRKFDSASSSASVFGQNTSGPVEDHLSSPAPSNSYSRGGFEP